MKAEHINPFLEATSSVVSMICGGVKPEFGNVYLNNTTYNAENVIIIIGVTGQLKGQVIFSMPPSVAQKLVSKMMGTEISAIDDMAKSALGELGNMILGNSSTLFFSKGISVEITPPTVVTGNNVEISNKNDTIHIPVKVSDIGNMDIAVAFKE